MGKGRFSDQGAAAVKWAELTAAQLGHSYVGSEHLLMGLSRCGDTGVRQLLEAEGIRETGLGELLLGQGQGISWEYPIQGLTPEALGVVYRAAGEAGRGQVEPVHLLLGLLREPKCSGREMLLSLGADPERLFTRSLERSRKRGYGGVAMTKLLDKFSLDLTQRAAAGECPTVIGREEELEQIIGILCRKTKNNPALVGKPGVGKTALAEKLAGEISGGRVPEQLRDKRVVALYMSSLVAGTKYRGGI